MKNLFRILKISVIYSLFICSVEYFIYFFLEGYRISFPLLWRNIANYLFFFTLLSFILILPFLFTKLKNFIVFIILLPSTSFFLIGYYIDKYHHAYFVKYVLWKIIIATVIIAMVLVFLLLRFEKTVLYLQLGFSTIVLMFLIIQRLIWNISTINPPAGNGVIVVLADAMRADRLNKETTPGLWEFARSSTMFTNAHSAASCTIPSVFSLFTGKLAYFYPEDRDAKIALKKEGTLAGFFKKRGYVTLGISANRLVSPLLGFDRGFHKFLNVGLEWWTFSLYKPAYYSLFPRYHIKVFKYLSLVPFKVRDSANFVNNEAISFINKYRGKRFFLYIHYMDPHAPYSPPEFLLNRKKPSWNHLRPLITMKLDRGFPVNTSAKLTPDLKYSLKTLYDAEVSYMDREFSKLITRLKNTGFLGRGTLVFLADHGEEFWDHGGVSHCHTLFEELIRVPLIINSPLLEKKVHTEFISSSFLVNYFLKTGKMKEFSSILSTVWHKKGIKRNRFREMFSILKYPRKITAEWRKLRGKTWWVFDAYDLERDPEETNSLPVTDGEKKEIKKIETMLKLKFKRVALKGSKKYMETLRALGYVR